MTTDTNRIIHRLKELIDHAERVGAKSKFGLTDTQSGYAWGLRDAIRVLRGEL